ncbi:MAG: ATP-binding protein [Solirubrobacteraceae bacterium]
MAGIRNPYRPGFNQAPEILAGREDVMEDLLDALEAVAVDRFTPPPLLLVGSRGMGKTTLLAEAASRAGREYGWPAVQVELEPDKSFTEELAAKLDAVATLVEQHGPRRAMQAQSATLQAKIAGVGGEVRFERASKNEPRSVREAFAQLASNLRERDSGFVLTLDEAHLADHAEMVAFAKMLQEATGNDWPAVVLLAGLPAMRDPDHTVTYFERGTWHELGLLQRPEAIAALQEPADRAGRPMDPDASELLAQASGGYPYALQLLGHHAWRQSANQPRIDADAAKRALPRAQRQLERGLYASRWEAAPPTHRRYLAAVAELTSAGQLASSRAVADRQGKSTKDLSKIRDQLIKYGTLTVQNDSLRFTIPGMADYVARQQAHEVHDASFPGQPAAAITPPPPAPQPRRDTRDQSRQPER